MFVIIFKLNYSRRFLPPHEQFDCNRRLFQKFIIVCLFYVDNIHSSPTLQLNPTNQPPTSTTIHPPFNSCAIFNNQLRGCIFYYCSLDDYFKIQFKMIKD